jgi:inner membrane protease ATP23
MSTPKGFESWRQSLANLTGLGLDDEQRAARNAESERQRLEKQWDRCERIKADIMTSSPMVIFMLRHLELAGCPFPAASIQCYPCDDTRSGGFAADYGILVCQNQFYNKKHLEETLSHELIHAFDHCRFKVDWYNLRHQACSEVSLPETPLMRSARPTYQASVA